MRWLYAIAAIEVYMNYEEQIRDHLSGIESSVDSILSELELEPPYLKIGSHYLPVFGSIRYVHYSDHEVHVYAGNESIGSWSGQYATMLIKWLNAHSVDIEAQL
jgi:hypothetical protein